jgi:hypothetical protein
VPSTEAPTETPGPCKKDSDCPVCDFACPPQFCGSDENCYVYTCQNFFRYHKETEFDGTGDSELTCEDVETDLHVSNFGCDIAVGALAPAPGVGMKPNRACFGVSKNGPDIISVECYDLNDTADYDTYEEDAASAVITCDDVGPFFFYSASYELEDVRTSISVTDRVVEARVTSSIDPVKVSESMFAAIFKDLAATMSPSSSPSTSEPSMSPSSPSMQPTVNVTEAPGCASDDDCPEQFCGTDGNCYDYTCEEFFRWHPTTEFDGNGDSQLTCEPRSTAIDVINFGCTRTVGSTTSDGGVGFQSNQQCIGASRNEEFLVTVECFNFAEDTDFASYVTEATAVDLTCSPDAGEIPEPRYFYGAGYTKSEFVDGGLQSSTVRPNGAFRTEVFEQDRAFKSMFAVVVREPFTSSPTPLPTPSPTESPTLPDLSAAISTNAWTGIAFSASIGLLSLL